MSLLDDSRFRLIGTLSDGLRTPLTAILGHADLLLDSRLSEAQHDSVDSIRQNGEALLRAVDDVLTLVEISSGTLEPRIETVLVRESFENALLGSRQKARAFDRMFALSFDANVPVQGRFDAARAGQAIRHLADNAVKFTERGSVVVRVGFESPRTLRVEVADTGPGLTPDAFAQLSNASKRGGAVSGIGLTLVRGVARALGAQVSCEGASGRGTRVVVSLSIEPVEGKASTPPTQRVGLGLSGRALVADDGADNRRLLGRILERVGLAVTTAVNGRDAVEAALADPPDLILMDVQMPVLDGIEATRELRAAGFEAPIIAVTANTAPHVEELCLSAGCDGHLTKPIDRLALLDAVETALRKSDQAG